MNNLILRIFKTTLALIVTLIILYFFCFHNDPLNENEWKTLIFCLWYSIEYKISLLEK